MKLTSYVTDCLNKIQNYSTKTPLIAINSTKGTVAFLSDDLGSN